jgi:hypothetical protein
MQEQRVGWCRPIALLVLNLGASKGWPVNAMPGCCSPEKDPVPTLQEVGVPRGWLWRGTQNLAFSGVRIPNRPANSESLYRPPLCIVYCINISCRPARKLCLSLKIDRKLRFCIHRRDAMFETERCGGPQARPSVVKSWAAHTRPFQQPARA